MDKRIQRTRKILGNALIDLLQEQPFHQITIRQITERANVAYSTFFRNFESIDQLLITHLGDLLQDLKSLAKRTSEDTVLAYSNENMRIVFQHVIDNEDKYRTLLKTPAVQPIVREFQQQLIADNLTLLQPHEDNLRGNIPPVELVIHTGVTQLFNIIEWWLDHDLSPDIDTMIIYYDRLVTRPTWYLLFGEDSASQSLNSMR